jgi:hypothetical protein
MGGLSFIYDDFCFWEGGKGSLNIVCPGCVCVIVHQDELSGYEAWRMPLRCM